MASKLLSSLQHLRALGDQLEASLPRIPSDSLAVAEEVFSEDLADAAISCELLEATLTTFLTAVASEVSVGETPKETAESETAKSAASAASATPSLTAAEKEAVAALASPPSEGEGGSKEGGEWSQTVSGRWAKADGSAGGCMNHATWRGNAQFFLRPTSGTTTTAMVRVEQKGGETMHGIGFYVLQGHNGKQLVEATPVVAKSSFRKAATVTAEVEVTSDSEGFVLIPTTYQPGEEAEFTVTCGDGIQVRSLTCDEKLVAAEIAAEWKGESAGGCRNHTSWIYNPQVLLSSPIEQEITLQLSQTAKSEFNAISMYVFADKGGRRLLTATEVVGKGSFSSSKQSTLTLPKFSGSAVIVPCTFEPGHEAPFSLVAFSQSAVTLKELTDAKEVEASGAWSVANQSAGGPPKALKWRGNPQFRVTVTPEEGKSASVSLRLLQEEKEGAELVPMGIYILTDKGSRRLTARPADLVTSTPFSKDKAITCDISYTMLKKAAGDAPEGQAVTLIAMPCTFSPGQEASFKLSAFASGASVTLEALSEVPSESVSYRCAGEMSGGCLNHSESWRDNRQVRLVAKASTRVFLLLQTDLDAKAERIGMYVTKAPENGKHQLAINEDTLVRKAPFRTAKETYCVLKVEEGQTYNIMPCTYNAGVEVNFHLSVYSPDVASLEFGSLTTPGSSFRAMASWFDHHAGGSSSHLTWWLNPRFLLDADPQEVTIVLRQLSNEETKGRPLLPIGFYVTNADVDGRPHIEEDGDILAMAPFEPSPDVCVSFRLPEHDLPLVIVPCTFEPGHEGDFELIVYCEQEDTGLEMLPLPDLSEIGEADEEDAGEEEASGEEEQVEEDLPSVPEPEPEAPQVPAAAPSAAAVPVVETVTKKEVEEEKAPTPAPAPEPTPAPSPPPNAADGPPPPPPAAATRTVVKGTPKPKMPKKDAKDPENLMEQIKMGTFLKKITPPTSPRSRPRKPPAALLTGMAAFDRIIARRTAVEPSDDEQSDEEWPDDDW